MKTVMTDSYHGRRDALKVNRRLYMMGVNFLFLVVANREFQLNYLTKFRFASKRKQVKIIVRDGSGQCHSTNVGYFY